LTQPGPGTRAVLFDALGTLLELEPPWPYLRGTLARRHGIEVPESDAKAAVLAEMAYYREHHVEGSDEGSLADLRRRCAGVLREHLPLAGALSLDEVTDVLLDSLRFVPFPDAAPTLASLRESGLRLAVVSNWDCSLPGVLSQVGLAAAVDEVVVSAQAGTAKPDPGIYSLTLERLRCAPQEAIFVGDSLETDVAGARATGVRALLIDRTGSSPADAGVERIASLADLPVLLGRTPE
jgi:putative hydrolase of the HAD superfamily